MPNRILIPAALRRFTSDQNAVEVEAGTVDEALKALVTRFKPLEAHLFQDGKLRSFVNVFVNDEDIRHLQKGATVLKAADTISIVPSIAGGS